MNPTHPSRPCRHVAIGSLASALLGLVAIGGCVGRTGEELDDTYGKVRGIAGGQSVAGTGALSSMFESAGWKSYTWAKLSPWLQKHDVIVWAPDDFQPPTYEQRAWLTRWLAEGDRQRTLVYIARDFDAASAYWKAVQPGAPPEQAQEIARREAEARAEFAARSKTKNDEDAGWFITDTTQPRRRVASLEGEWADGIDASKAEIEIGTRLDFSNIPQLDLLLYSGPDALVAAHSAGNSRFGIRGYQGEVIVVANGSFLLNEPLVNKEHRKLAAKLIERCGSPGSVVFLESGSRGPLISNKDELENTRSPFEMLDAFPMGMILLHAAFAGLVACAWLYPIFGNPKVLRPATRTDFSQHVRALGALMARNQNANYAEQQLASYHAQVPKQAPGSASGRALPSRRKRVAPVQAPTKGEK